MNIHQFYLTNKRLFDIKQKLTDLFQQRINQHDKVPSLWTQQIISIPYIYI